MSDTITATALDRLRDLLDRFDTDGVQGVFEAEHPDEPEGTNAYPFMFGVLEQRARVVVAEADRDGEVGTRARTDGHIYCRARERALERDRASLRAEAEDNRLAMIDADLQRDQARIERDRYFDALAVIYKGVSGEWARDVARTALYGGGV